MIIDKELKDLLEQYPEYRKEYLLRILEEGVEEHKLDLVVVNLSNKLRGILKSDYGVNDKVRYTSYLYSTYDDYLNDNDNCDLMLDFLVPQKYGFYDTLAESIAELYEYDEKKINEVFSDKNNYHYVGVINDELTRAFYLNDKGCIIVSKY